MWAMHCCMILIGLNLWDVINLAVLTSTCPTPLPTSAAPAATVISTQASTPALALVLTTGSILDPIAEWDCKNSKALAQISL